MIRWFTLGKENELSYVIVIWYIYITCKHVDEYARKNQAEIVEVV